MSERCIARLLLTVWLTVTNQNVFLSNILTELDILVTKYLGFLGNIRTNFKKYTILHVATLFMRTGHINNDKKQSWIIVGSGSGSGILLLVVICGCLYWGCKNCQSQKSRSPAHVMCTDPENPNMMHTREDAIRSGRGSELGLKTVGIWDPVSDIGRVVDVRLQHAFTEAVLDQLAANGADVEKHHRKLREQQNALVPATEY